MIALKTSEMSGGFKVLDREARIRPGTNKSQTFGLFLVHSQRIRTRSSTLVKTKEMTEPNNTPRNGTLLFELLLCSLVLQNRSKEIS